jgi:cytochrome c-type biogenesis protein CcmE
MGSKLIKILISLAVVGGGIGYLLYSTAGEALEYYKHVDEIASSRDAWQRKPMQLHGYVVPGSIQKRFDRDHGRLEYRFRETNCGQDMEVLFAGVVPDTFKDGAEVVVKGELDGDQFHSTEVMAKCPSKYQATEAPKNFCTKGRAN